MFAEPNNVGCTAAHVERFGRPHLALPWERIQKLLLLAAQLHPDPRRIDHVSVSLDGTDVPVDTNF
jgi:hypothetical protein